MNILRQTGYLSARSFTIRYHQPLTRRFIRTGAPKMESIPVVTYGRRAEIATAIQKLLLPEYDVVHIILDLPTALHEIPLILTLTPPSPASTLGTNAARAAANEPLRTPKAVIFGGGIPDEEVAQVKAAVSEEQRGEVLWVNLTMEDYARQGVQQGPSPPVANVLVREKLREGGL
ncbi:hypothetical protein P152DRAFT_482343 [Eremomyces bilateralis CBS 781.70]|uniref:Uncharacterized protein n=1 Tax=Eremomyces bilateralis CBS 781.70 TaxID=1392243 RepID=A0A6G1G2I4_9PEZI|nr:uncharacterized protein P152DRAFT_482343 [Eremomyces bilateralis CBS 781.70]KAF1812315.1 hypothetical protein P152DRAFT_482343 [Eremomyces bilateralis CBS 781.70]